MVEYSDGRLIHHKFLFFRHYRIILLWWLVVGLFRLKVEYSDSSSWILHFSDLRIGLSPIYSREGTHATNGLHEIQHADFPSAYNSANKTTKRLFILAYLVGIFHFSSEYSRFNRNIPHYSVFVRIFHNFHMSEYSVFRRIRKILFRSNTT